MMVSVLSWRARGLILASLWVVCFSAVGAPAPERAEAVTLRPKWRHQLQFAGCYAALEKGPYRGAGLQVRLEKPLERADPGRWRHIADTSAEVGLNPNGASPSGSVYERKSKPGPRRYYAVAGGLAALLVLVVLTGFWLRRIYRNLRREMAERARAEQRFRLLVERAPFPIAISVPDTGVIRFCNQQWVKDFMPDEMADGKWSTSDFYQDPVDRRRILELLGEQEYVRDFEVQLKRSHGKTSWAYLSAALIDFGEEQALLVAFNDITARKAAEQENVRLIEDLQKALQDVKTLRGLIPICAYCKRIRNDAGFWLQVDTYVQEHTHAEFSHGVCPECLEQAYKDFAVEGPPPASDP